MLDLLSLCGGRLECEEFLVMKLFLIFIFLFLYAVADEKIRFGVFAYKGIEQTRAQYEPVVEELNKKLNGRVELFVLTQDELSKKVKQGELDIITTNPAHFLSLRYNYGLGGAVATLRGYKDGIITDKLAGVIVVKNESEIKELKDVASKNIATPSLRHLGGFMAQAYELKIHGIDILKHKEKIKTFTTHQDVIKAVVNNKTDVGFVRDGILEEMYANGELERGQLRVVNEFVASSHPFVHSTALYPEWPVAPLNHTPSALSKEFVAALFDIRPSERLKLAGIYDYTMPYDYILTEEILRALKMPPFDKVAEVSVAEILSKHQDVLVVTGLFLIVLIFFVFKKTKERNLFHLLLSNMGEGVYGVDKQGRCIWINKKALEILGYSEKEVVGTNQHHLFHHHRVDGREYGESECPIFLSSQDGKSRSVNDWFVKKDGSFLPVSLIITATNKDEAIVVFRDISNERAIELKQEALQRELVAERDLFSSGPVLVITWLPTENWPVTYVSANVTELLGFTPSEMIDEHFVYAELIHPDDIAMVAGEVSAYMAAKQDAFEQSYRLRCKNGVYKWFYDFTQMVRDETGKIVAIHGYIFDQTQLKTVQDELVRKDELFELFFKQSMYGFFFMMIDEPIEWHDGADKEALLDYVFEHQRITKVNGAMLSQYGAKEEEFLGFRPKDFFAHDLAYGRRIWGEFFDRGTWHLDTAEEKFDGTQMIINGDYICLYDKQGRITGHFGVQKDVTAERRMQDAIIEAKDEAQKANSSKSLFLANMSHEIRTPINAIVGFTDLILQTKLDDEQKNFAQKMQLSSKMLLGIVNDLLDYSKMEAGKLELERSCFDIQSVFNSLKSMFMGTAQSKKLSFSCSLDEKMPALLLGDELRLTQVLINLINNALKFTEYGFVSLRVAILSQTSQNIVLRFSVKDSGIGMNEAEVGRLFSPFMQADVSTTRRYGGTGLGLSIATKLVSAMNGKLEVFSEQGVGSEFVFDAEFGVVQSGTIASKCSIDVASSYPDFSHLKLLLVEDNAVNQEVVIAMLAKSGIALTVANNGKEALDIIVRDDKFFDIVLMDLQMPIMDGYEASRRIMESGKKVPIVALSATIMLERRESLAKHGISDYLSKPIDMKRLMGVIAKWCSLSSVENVEMLDSDYLASSIGASPALQKKLYTIFLSELEGKFASLVDEISSKDVQAKGVVHALKGASGNLGLTKLYSLLSAIDALYKDEKQIPDTMINELSTVLEQTKEHLGATLTTLGNDTITKAVSDDEFAALMQLARKILKEGGIMPASKQQLFYDALTSRVGADELEGYVQAIENFDYDLAIERLNQWNL